MLDFARFRVLFAPTQLWDAPCPASVTAGRYAVTINRGPERLVVADDYAEAVEHCWPQSEPVAEISVRFGWPVEVCLSATLPKRRALTREGALALLEGAAEAAAEQVQRHSQWTREEVTRLVEVN